MLYGGLEHLWMPSRSEEVGTVHQHLEETPVRSSITVKDVTLGTREKRVHRGTCAIPTRNINPWMTARGVSKAGIDITCVNGDEYP